MSDVQLYGQLNVYMNEFLNVIMQDQIILKFLYYNTNDDVLSKPDLTMSQKKSMINNTIFKYRKVPSLNDRVMQTYLAMEFGSIDRMKAVSYREANPFFFRPTIDVFVITSDGNSETKNGGRVEAIESRLMELFHFTTHDATLGKSRIRSSDSIYGLPSPYSGREINIEFWDVNPIDKYKLRFDDSVNKYLGE